MHTVSSKHTAPVFCCRTQVVLVPFLAQCSFCIVQTALFWCLFSVCRKPSIWQPSPRACWRPWLSPCFGHGGSHTLIGPGGRPKPRCPSRARNPVHLPLAVPGHARGNTDIPVGIGGCPAYAPCCSVVRSPTKQTAQMLSAQARIPPSAVQGTVRRPMRDLGLRPRFRSGRRRGLRFQSGGIPGAGAAGNGGIAARPRPVA